MKKIKISYVRRAIVILVSLIFLLSYYFDIQILEGSLIGSRFIGFHLIDPFVTVEFMITNSAIPINLIIGAGFITLFYILIGGRAFCSWVCPYTLISEASEKVHLWLVRKSIIKGDLELPFGRYWFLLLWLALALTTGYLIFEMFNIMAITSRTIIYGVTLATLMILPVFILEVFSRRVWCKNICPVGTTYGLLNKISAGKIAWQGSCNKCLKCVDVCYDKNILSFIKSKEIGSDKPYYINDTGCTFCSACIDVCPHSCLSYKNRLTNLV